MDFKLDEEEDYMFLKQILHSTELHALFKAHDAILLTNAEIGPALSNSTQIAEQVPGGWGGWSGWIYYHDFEILIVYVEEEVLDDVKLA